MMCCRSLLIRLFFCVFFPTFILSKAVNDSSERIQGSYTNASKSRELNFTVQLGIESLNQSYEECDCGTNSISCRQVLIGRKCICKDGYVAVKPFLKFDEECKKCDCGVRSTSCKLDEYLKKTCTCEDGYAPKISSSYSEEQCERCECENQATACEYDILARRKCTCRKGYAPYAFRTDEVCVRCDCGIDELSCAVDYNGLRKCICGGDSVAVRTNKVEGEKCEKCSCGPNSVSCKMLYGYKSCTCSSGYVAIDKLPLSWDEECVLSDGDLSPSSRRVAIYVASVVFALIVVIIVMLFYHKPIKRFFFRRRAVVT